MESVVRVAGLGIRNVWWPVLATTDLWWQVEASVPGSLDNGGHVQIQFSDTSSKKKS